MSDFTHLDAAGRLTMVEVGDKPGTKRQAAASCRIVVGPKIYPLLVGGDLPKGDVWAAARLAGIMAAKNTAQLIPLCHQLPLTGVEIDFTLEPANHAVVITSRVRTEAKTGVEMETLVAAAAAALGENLSQEQRDALAMVAKLQLAQVKLQLGRVVEAQEILVGLAGAPRELYTAHRLLDLLQARYGSEGMMMEATLLQRQMDDVRTRAMVTTPKHDFVVARSGRDADGFSHVPLLRTERKPPAPKVPAGGPESNSTPPPKKTAKSDGEQETKEEPKKPAQIRIAGMFGGKGVFQVQGSKVWYRHVHGPKPGLVNNQPRPIQINGIPWHMAWNANETRPYLALTPPFLPPSASQIVVSCSNKKAAVTVVEYPAYGNNYSLVFAIDFRRKSPELEEATIEISW